MAAAAVLFEARRGGFNSMMGFPLVFAAVVSAVFLVAPFVGRRSSRAPASGLLALAALLAWGGVWSHQAFFEREREALDRQGREAFADQRVESIPYTRALNPPDPGPGTLPLDARQTLVNVWATWCSPCVEEMPLLERFWQMHRDSGVTLVGVTRLSNPDGAGRTEELARLERFLIDRGVSYPILIVDDDVYARFQPRRLPTSLWLQDGKVQDYRVTVDGTRELLKAIEARLASGHASGTASPHGGLP